MKCWYKEYTLGDVERTISKASPRELLEIVQETLRRLGCYQYGYADTPIGEKYVGKLKVLAEKIDKWENNPSGFGEAPEDIIKWITGVMKNKLQMNKILLPRFQFREET